MSSLKFFMGKNNSVATTSGDTPLLDSSIQQRRRASEEEVEEEELEEEGLRKKGKMATGTSAIVNNITGTITPAAENNGGSDVRVALSEVVADCVKRWFKDTLREAKDGDINMQILVGQMYNSGYGVPRDTQKGKLWMTRASRVRASAWKVSQKQPGYNVSDSDSEETKDDS